MIDYMIMEAVAIKVMTEDAKAQKEAEDKAKRDAFKKDLSSLEQYR